MTVIGALSLIPGTTEASALGLLAYPSDCVRVDRDLGAIQNLRDLCPTDYVRRAEFSIPIFAEA